MNDVTRLIHERIAVVRDTATGYDLVIASSQDVETSLIEYRLELHRPGGDGDVIDISCMVPVRSDGTGDIGSTAEYETFRSIKR